MFFQLMTDGVARQGKSQDLSRKFYRFIGELFEFSPANGNQFAFLTTKEKNGSRLPIREPFGVRMTGGIRTHDLPLSHREALSAELQPHACES